MILTNLLRLVLVCTYNLVVQTTSGRFRLNDQIYFYIINYLKHPTDVTYVVHLNFKILVYELLPTITKMYLLIYFWASTRAYEK